jgi:5-methylcytosine-specific restriction protein A
MPKATRAHRSRVNEIVDARDAGRCRRCGCITGLWFSRQHRIPRKAGGSARVDRPSNLVTLCGSATSPRGCHLWAESQRTEAEQQGYLLPALNPDVDPAREPLWVIELGWVLLDDDGGITPCPAPYGGDD